MYLVFFIFKNASVSVVIYPGYFDLIQKRYHSAHLSFLCTSHSYFSEPVQGCLTTNQVLLINAYTFCCVFPQPVNLSKHFFPVTLITVIRVFSEIFICQLPPVIWSNLKISQTMQYLMNNN